VSLLHAKRCFSLSLMKGALNANMYLIMANGEKKNVFAKFSALKIHEVCAKESMRFAASEEKFGILRVFKTPMSKHFVSFVH
jgi:hypothetical protein